MEGNNQNAGFVMISRKLFDHDFWNDKRQFSRAEAWIDLIRLAHYGDQPKRYVPQSQYINFIMIHRGELVASHRYLAEKWGWSVKKVFTFINFLIARQMIIVDKTQGVNHIKLVNFEQYNTPQNSFYNDRADFGNTITASLAPVFQTLMRPAETEGKHYGNTMETEGKHYGNTMETEGKHYGNKIEESIKNNKENKEEEEVEEKAAAVFFENELEKKNEKQTQGGGQNSLTGGGAAALAARIGNQAQQVWINDGLEAKFSTPAHAALCLDWLQHCKERDRPATGSVELRTLLNDFNNHSLSELIEVVNYSVRGKHTNLYFDILDKKKPTSNNTTAAGWDSKITPESWRKKVKYATKNTLAWD
jgi:hypothetical protein